MYDLIIIAVLLLLGFLFGRWAERSHYRDIIEREKILNSLPAFASRVPPNDKHYHHRLVAGNVVVANDYFKAFIAGLRQIFGGRIRTYETLIDRARREALLRLKEKANEIGAEYVFNVKYETASISKGGRLPIIEVCAYGTALIDSRSNGQPVVKTDEGEWGDSWYDLDPKSNPRRYGYADFGE